MSGHVLSCCLALGHTKQRVCILRWRELGSSRPRASAELIYLSHVLHSSASLSATWIKPTKFAAFAIMQNVCSSPHRDAQQLETKSGGQQCLTSSKGGIWHEFPGGSDWRELRASGVEEKSSPSNAKVSARTHFHSTEPWQGTDALSLPTSRSSWSIFHRLMLPIAGPRLPLP